MSTPKAKVIPFSVFADLYRPKPDKPADPERKPADVILIRPALDGDAYSSRVHTPGKPVRK